MLLNILAEPVTGRHKRTLKAIHYLENELHRNIAPRPASATKRSVQDCIPIERFGQPDLQLSLIAEEFEEFKSAVATEHENELKELADLVYVCFQYAENMEWDLEEALDRVHKSNMSKLGLDGKAIRRVDGKVLKGQTINHLF